MPILSHPHLLAAASWYSTGSTVLMFSLFVHTRNDE
jgi:hypothetical protein